MSDLPSVIQVEFLHRDASSSFDDSARLDHNFDRIVRFLWEKLSLKRVVVPRILYDLIGQRNQKGFEQRGIVVRCTEDSGWD